LSPLPIKKKNNYLTSGQEKLLTYIYIYISFLDFWLTFMNMQECSRHGYDKKGAKRSGLAEYGPWLLLLLPKNLR
jgi:hypothetical protein